MATYKELINEAIETLKSDDDIFCQMIEDLDSWNGYADGFKCYEMWELDDLCSGMKISEFVDKLDDFRAYDEYFYWSIYGIESTNDKTALYRENVDEGDLLDNIIEWESDLNFWGCCEDFHSLILEIINCNEDEDEE